MGELVFLDPVRDSTQGSSAKSSTLAPSEQSGEPLNEPAQKQSLGFKVFQNVTAIFAGRVISIPLSIATSILLVRFLGREHMGEYGALYAYLSFFGFLSTTALAQILAREASVRRAEAAQIFHVATIVAFAFSLLGTALAYLLGPEFGFHSALHWLILVAALDVLVLPPFQQPGVIYQVDMRQWFAVGIGLLRQVLWLAAVVLLALHNAAFYEVIVARTLCGGAQCAALLLLLRQQRLLTGPRRFDWTEARLLVRESFPLALTALAVSVYHRIDQVMLHNMSGDKVLGPYVVAVQMTEFFSLLPNALMSSLFPALSQSVNDPQRFDRYLRESYRFLMVVVFAACAVVTPVAAPFVQLFYGKEFLPTAPLLIVLIWSEVPIFFAAVLGNAMIAKGLQRYSPVSAVGGAVCNVLLNFVMIPRYGALGASWATVVSYSLAGIFLLLIFSKIRHLVLRGLRMAFVPLLLALAITLGVRLLPWIFWWKLLVSCLAYGGLAVLLGLIGRRDFERFRAMFRMGAAHD